MTGETPMISRFAHLFSSPSRPGAALATAARFAPRVAAAVQPLRRPGRASPLPASDRRQGRFSHLVNAEFERAPTSGYSPVLSGREIQEMWSRAFQNAGVKVNAGRALNRPTRGVQGQWDKALAKAGLIKFS